MTKLYYYSVWFISTVRVNACSPEFQKFSVKYVLVSIKY